MSLLVLGLLLPLRAQATPPQLPERLESSPIQTVDEALDRLPPIGREGTFDRDSGTWTFDPAVDWLEANLAGGGVLSDEQWRRALTRSGAVRVRERWPVELPLALSIEKPAWLTRGVIRLAPVNPEWDAAQSGDSSWCGNCSDSNYRAARYQELGPLGLGPQTLEFEVVVERGAEERYFYQRDAKPPEPSKVLWTGSLTLHVQGVETFEEALPGAHDESLDAAIRKAIDVTLFDVTDLVLVGDVDRVPELFDTAVSLEIELRQGDRVVGTDARMILDRPGFIYQAMSFDLPGDLPDLSSWSLQIRGRPTETLHAWNAKRYWNGVFVIPLADVPKR